MTDFFRFPQTPHLAWLGGGEPRDDKVLSASEAKDLLAGNVLVEEKLDGANVGFSLAQDGALRTQNRGQYLREPFSGQFSRLQSWLSMHGEAMRASLTPDLIAFGEWCAARHSLDYSALPDWWLMFDVYDRKACRFWSAHRRDEWASEAGVITVKRITQGRFDQTALKTVLIDSPSAYRSGPLEGIVIRSEHGEWLTHRAKLVRPDFAQSIEVHWRKRPLQWNRLEV